MGVMYFQLPPQLAADDPLRQDLERASIAGGQDNMPYPTEAIVNGDRLSLQRAVNDSGSLQVPWRIADVGQLMVSSATLMEREKAYPLTIELARGKVNQLRGQTADWVMGGLFMTPALQQLIQQATHSFGQSIMELPDPSAFVRADQALCDAHRAAFELTSTYMRQVFRLRHERQPRLDASLTCRLGAAAPTPEQTPRFLQAFNAVTLPFPWNEIEARRGKFDWQAADQRVAWATANNLRIVGGPLIDFGGRDLPDWLWESTHDLNEMTRLLCEYLDTIIRRYQPNIRAWQITSGTNSAGTFAQRDDELIWLTMRLAETARRVNPVLELIVGIAHPWGDYLAEQERSKTPFVFADDLLRMGLKPSAIDLELIMGISPRGSYCRGLLDTSRLLDLYALLGVPIQATLGYPSSATASERADFHQRVNLGYWRSGHNEEAQADWAAAFAGLVLCKPYVRTVQWAHWSDADLHAFPNCGLMDTQGRPKPALTPLVELRTAHLK